MAEQPTLILAAMRTRAGEWHLHLQMPDSRTCWVTIHGEHYRALSLHELAGAIQAKLGPPAQLPGEPQGIPEL